MNSIQIDRLYNLLSVFSGHLPFLSNIQRLVLVFHCNAEEDWTVPLLKKHYVVSSTDSNNPEGLIDERYYC